MSMYRELLQEAVAMQEHRSPADALAALIAARSHMEMESRTRIDLELRHDVALVHLCQARGIAVEVEDLEKPDEGRRRLLCRLGLTHC